MTLKFAYYFALFIAYALNIMEKETSGMDMEKFGEVIKETSVVPLNLPLRKLEEIKEKLVAGDEKLKDMELGQIKDFLDLYNSIFVAVKTYHIRYEINKEPIVKQPIVPEIPLNNKEWHKVNRLKTFATIDEKVKRHIDHIVNCKCGPMPKYVKKEIEKRMKEQ